MTSTRQVAAIACVVGCCAVAEAATPFAVRIVDYSPAPGQFVRVPDFADPEVTLGPPSGGGTFDADDTSVVTLGGFGGSITLAFDHVVEDHPLNYFGMDAIVFGNAFWAGEDPDRHFAECAMIEVCLDLTGDDCAAGTWYLIPGSHIADPGAQFATRTWDDNVADATYPPATAAWIPPGYAGVWTTTGYLLPSDIFAGDLLRIITNPEQDTGVEGIFGYADFAPTLILGDTDGDNVVDDQGAVPESFYTLPDDPLTVGMSPGCGGGDAFDIAWAIDPQTSLPANLPGFNLIRITNAVDYVALPLGEISPEIGAVSDAAPDPFGDHDDDGDIDLADIAEFLLCYGSAPPPKAPCARFDREGDEAVGSSDAAVLMERMTGP